MMPHLNISSITYTHIYIKYFAQNAPNVQKNKNQIFEKFQIPPNLIATTSSHLDRVNNI